MLDQHLKLKIKEKYTNYYYYFYFKKKALIRYLKALLREGNHSLIFSKKEKKEKIDFIITQCPFPSLRA